jgi:hypothetical protein
MFIHYLHSCYVDMYSAAQFNSPYMKQRSTPQMRMLLSA